MKEQTKVIDLPSQQMTVQTAVNALDTQPVTVEQMICRGIDRGLPVETMERLLAMRRELKAELAKEAFDRAMAAFQADCPSIHKSKAVYVKGALRYRYAPLEVIIDQVKETMARHGFSHKEDAIVEPGWVTGLCKVTHTMGHNETTTFKVPIDKDAFMGEAQKFASAFTFTKRYAFCAAFGIMTADEDDDSAAAGETPQRPQSAQQPTTRIEHPRNQAPAAPKPQPNAIAPGVYPSVTVLSVEAKPKDKKDENGKVIKSWVSHKITFSDGFGELTCWTFDKKIADLASDLANTQERGNLRTQPGKDPKFTDIVSLERAEAPPPITPKDEDQVPFDFDEHGQPIQEVTP